MCDLSRPGSAQRPGTSMRHSSPLSRPSTTRPSSAFISSRPSSADSDLESLDYEASDLTHGEYALIYYYHPHSNYTVKKIFGNFYGNLSSARFASKVL